ncbi:MAG: hypothetical protein ACYCY3_08775 [Halothiobacillus sp.]
MIAPIDEFNSADDAARHPVRVKPRNASPEIVDAAGIHRQASHPGSAALCAGE